MNWLLNQDQEHTVHTPDLQLVPVFLELMENITLDVMQKELWVVFVRKVRPLLKWWKVDVGNLKRFMWLRNCRGKCQLHHVVFADNLLRNFLKTMYSYFVSLGISYSAFGKCQARILEKYQVFNLVAIFIRSCLSKHKS